MECKTRGLNPECRGTRDPAEWIVGSMSSMPPTEEGTMYRAPTWVRGTRRAAGREERGMRVVYCEIQNPFGGASSATVRVRVREMRDEDRED